jgi:predicted nucleic acid-binding protein
MFTNAGNTKHDYEQFGEGRLTNDSLIAMSAGRLGITVITANARDFARLAEVRPFQRRVEGPEAH